jgi:hypothetical protein
MSRGSHLGERRGGRKKGTPNKATVARATAIAASGLTPLDYVLSVMRDENADPHTRLDAAKAALPFCHPRLAPQEPRKTDPDFVPLPERLKEYLREAAIKSADRNVVEPPRRQIPPGSVTADGSCEVLPRFGGIDLGAQR